MLKSDRQWHVPVHVSPRHGPREARQQRLHHDLIDHLAAPQEKVDRQVTILVSALGRGEILRQEGRDDTDRGVIPAGNVQRQASPGVVGGAVDHRKCTLGRLGQEEFDGVDSVKLGSDVDRQTALVVHVVDALLVSGVNDLQSGEVIVGRSVVYRHGPHLVPVDEGLGVQHKSHINEERPSVAMSGDHVKGQFSRLLLHSLGQLRRLVQHALDHRPILVANAAVELLGLVHELGAVQYCHLRFLHLEGGDGPRGDGGLRPRLRLWRRCRRRH
mmetsp:Transcript_28965/g.85683  ORF Transcript_28965/g.85683 Transcript_28965/m.85683 type:complete len:272 (+) Transcript_28965:2039-2854(+)